MPAHSKPQGPQDIRWKNGSILAASMFGNGWIEWCGPMRWRVRPDLTLPPLFKRRADERIGDADG